MLNESLIQKARQSMIGSRNPILPIKSPIKAIKDWEKTESRLKKRFKFDDNDQRNEFIFQVLSYESVKGHNAKILIDELNVEILIFTKTLNRVTEADKEYSRAVDLIEREVKYKNDD